MHYLNEIIKISFIVFFLSIYYMTSYLNKYDYYLPILDGLKANELKQFKLKYSRLNKIKLNYHGKCGKILKNGKANNKRDLVMFAYNSSKIKKNLKRALMVYIVIDSIKRSIPNAKKICFVPKNSFNDFVIKIIKKNDILIIKEKDLLNIHLVSSRFLYEYKYLKKNINFFDRVIHADLTDIYFFSDVFKTLKPNQLIMNKECGENSVFGKKGNFILKHKAVIKWFNESFGVNKTIVNLFKKINPKVINAGVIMGDAKEYLHFLDIFVKNLDYTKAYKFGYDQMLINVLFYTGVFNKIDIKFDSCTQRSCFNSKLKLNKKILKFYFKNGCSPVLIHKLFL